MQAMNSEVIVVDTFCLLEALTRGREVDRAEALQVLDGRGRTIDRDRLREAIVEQLRERFGRKRGSQEQDEEVADTRRWLLGALGRLVRDDMEAAEFAETIDPSREPDPLARCAALEGLIASGVPELEGLVREVVEREKAEKEPLVRMVAVAFLASREDGNEWWEEIKAGLKGRDKARWATLWALGSVPLEASVPFLCMFVRSANKDVTRHLTVYRAIRALATLPDTFRLQMRKEAASTLANFVRRQRIWPAWDEARTKALAALGNLGDESVAPTLIEELTDRNPAIAREAAMSLEKLLGVQTATARVVEAACRHIRERGRITDTRLTHTKALADALRWMRDRKSVVEELETAMVSGSPAQQEVARTLLGEIGGTEAFQKLQARKMATENYLAAMDRAEQSVRKLFDDTVNEARDGFRVAIRMDKIVFYLGVSLLVISALLALYHDSGSLEGWAGVGLTGATGVLGVLYGTLVANPRRQVEEATDHLMHLKVVFLAYIRQLHQVDQAYTRRLLEDENAITLEDVDKFSTMVERTMSNAAQQIKIRNGAKQPGGAISRTHKTNREAPVAR
jgi:HEAT repeat protein